MKEKYLDIMKQYYSNAWNADDFFKMFSGDDRKYTLIDPSYEMFCIIIDLKDFKLSEKINKTMINNKADLNNISYNIDFGSKLIQITYVYKDKNEFTSEVKENMYRLAMKLIEDEKDKHRKYMENLENLKKDANILNIIRKDKLNKIV